MNGWVFLVKLWPTVSFSPFTVTVLPYCTWWFSIKFDHGFLRVSSTDELGFSTVISALNKVLTLGKRTLNGYISTHWEIEDDSLIKVLPAEPLHHHTGL